MYERIVQRTVYCFGHRLTSNSNICCKWMGPGWFIPIISLCFGIASIGTAFVHDIHSICGVRFVLGIFEAGMLPGIGE
jgi:tellurite resistance protein TehA-like permease